jgi:hypothetical protein
MFVDSSKYKQVVTSISEEKGDLLAAVAFWGSGAESFIQPHSGKQIKLICNLASGATNPLVIDILRSKSGVLLKQHDRLHAKVFVGSNSALVGSANFSSNGLNLEGVELSGWQEAGWLTSDSLQIGAIRQWFSALWEESREISDLDIEVARHKWIIRRSERPKLSPSFSQGFSLAKFSHSELVDRRVYVAIYGDWISDEAKNAYKAYREQLSGQRQQKSVKLPPIYEDWPDLPKEAQLIDVYYGPRGAIRCYGVFTRTHDIIFNHRDGSNGHLAVCRKEDHVIGYKFGSKEASNFAKELRSCIDEIWKSEFAIGGDEGKYINIADAANLYRICNKIDKN